MLGGRRHPTSACATAHAGGRPALLTAAAAGGHRAAGSVRRSPQGTSFNDGGRGPSTTRSFVLVGCAGPWRRPPPNNGVRGGPRRWPLRCRQACYGGRHRPGTRAAAIGERGGAGRRPPRFKVQCGGRRVVHKCRAAAVACQRQGRLRLSGVPVLSGGRHPTTACAAAPGGGRCVVDKLATAAAADQSHARLPSASAEELGGGRCASRCSAAAAVLCTSARQRPPLANDEVVCPCWVCRSSAAAAIQQRRV